MFSRRILKRSSISEPEIQHYLRSLQDPLPAGAQDVPLTLLKASLRTQQVLRAGQRAELASGLKWHLAGSSDTASPTSTKTHPVNTENRTHAGHQQSPAGRISYSVHEPWRPQQTRTWKGSPDAGVPDLNQGKAYMPLAAVAPRTSHCPLRAGRASEGERRLAAGEVRMHLLPGHGIHSTAPSQGAGDGLATAAQTQSHLTVQGRRRPAQGHSLTDKRAFYA